MKTPPAHKSRGKIVLQHGVGPFLTAAALATAAGGITGGADIAGGHEAQGAVSGGDQIEAAAVPQNGEVGIGVQNFAFTLQMEVTVELGGVAAEALPGCEDFFTFHPCKVHGKIGVEAVQIQGVGQIVKQVQHFQPKLRLVFSSLDTSLDGY